MESKLLERASLFTSYLEVPILFVENLFNDGVDYWFIVYQFREANPSNHIHYNEIVKGRCINSLVRSNQQYDKQLFLTQIEYIEYSSINFSQSKSWVKIK